MTIEESDKITTYLIDKPKDFFVKMKIKEVVDHLKKNTDIDCIADGAAKRLLKLRGMLYKTRGSTKPSDRGVRSDRIQRKLAKIIKHMCQQIGLDLPEEMKVDLINIIGGKLLSSGLPESTENQDVS